MRIILKLHKKLFILLTIVLTASVVGGCAELRSAPLSTVTKTTTSTATVLPTKTPNPTKTLLPTATSTPTKLELLNERTMMLFGDPASTVIDFLLEIQDYVKTDNKENLASLILYPITIHSIDGEDVEIKTEEEFISNYQKIATPKWKAVILAQEPTELFTNWKGVMVNRGELWFGSVCLDTACKETKYYIYSIVNDTPW